MFDPASVKKLSNLEFLVYEYVVRNMEKVVYMSIRDLSNEAHVSTTTILRFCKKFNCKGFPEFKFKLKLYLDEVEKNNLLNDRYVVLDTLNKILKNDEFERKLDELCDLVHSKEYILFVGGGLSGNIAKYAARYITSVGKFSGYVDDLIYPYHHIIRTVLVIVISTSGETPELISAVNKFKQNDCQIASITNRENSTIAKMSTFNVSYYVSEERFEGADLTSHLVPMYIIESLGKKLIQKNNGSK